MKISFEEAMKICNKAQYNEATWFEILKLKLYMLVNPKIRKTSNDNTKLSSLCEKAKLQALEKEDKEKMKRTIEELL